MRTKLTTYDWAAMLEHINGSGMSDDQIRRELGGVLTKRMVGKYRGGVQPLYYRGNLMLDLWCRVTGKAPDLAPLAEVVRGHRVDRRLVKTGPAMESLAQWPPCPQPAAPKKRGRPRKTA